MRSPTLAVRLVCCVVMPGTYTSGLVASITSGVIASLHRLAHVRCIKTGKQEFPMPLPMTSYLKKVLVADAAISGAAAVAMMAGSTFLPPLLGLPAELLLWAGVALIPFVAGLALVIRQHQVAAGVIVAIIAINSRLGARQPGRGLRTGVCDHVARQSVRGCAGRDGRPFRRAADHRSAARPRGGLTPSQPPAFPVPPVSGRRGFVSNPSAHHSVFRASACAALRSVFRVSASILARSCMTCST